MLGTPPSQWFQNLSFRLNPNLSGREEGRFNVQATLHTSHGTLLNLSFDGRRTWSFSLALKKPPTSVGVEPLTTYSKTSTLPINCILVRVSTVHSILLFKQFHDKLLSVKNVPGNDNALSQLLIGTGSIPVNVNSIHTSEGCGALPIYASSWKENKAVVIIFLPSDWRFSAHQVFWGKPFQGVGVSY